MPFTFYINSIIVCEFWFRSHQLRVHMMHIGHPIVGDSLYSPHLHLLKITGRMFLHAESITISHPITNEEMTFTAGSLD